MDKEITVLRLGGGGWISLPDFVAVEEPLEIRLGEKSVALTMRTPGHDEDLAAGFLFSEGVLHSPSQVKRIFPCGKANTIRVELEDGVVVDWKRLERHFYRTSSCGVCGKASLEALSVVGVKEIPREGFKISKEIICEMPLRLRAEQEVFDKTGGLHAAALFSREGKLISCREDVGRHNAVDKLLGAQFLEGRTPLSDVVLFLSGRTSFELMQKAVVAGIPMVVAVGAPSSLAVDLAKQFHVTLLGFTRDKRFNIYHGEERVS